MGQRSQALADNTHLHRELEIQVRLQRQQLIPADKMTQTQARREFQLPQLESVIRLRHLPIVETGWNYAGNIYNRIKKSNSLLYWTFDQAEASVHTAIDTASPAVYFFQGPITALDKVLCRSLDIVEQRVPSINLPPQMKDGTTSMSYTTAPSPPDGAAGGGYKPCSKIKKIYFNTKQYVNDVGTKIVRPVLKRADSVKQIGNSVLSSKYTAFAADKLDGALNVADKYVDKYLPDDAADKGTDEVDAKYADGPAGTAIKTIRHMDRFSRKLQRRLTKRTLAEAKALKHQSAEAIHVLVYVAELIATDPKLAYQKGCELWASLSKDEPENQARPENLEQLIVLLTRESARRIVHLVNFTSSTVGKLPRRAASYVRKISNQCIQLVNSLLQNVHMDGVRQAIMEGAKMSANTFTILLKQLNIYTTDLLEHLAEVLAKQIQQPPQTNQSSKSAPSSTPTHVTVKKPTPQNHQLRSVLETLQPPPAQRVQLRASHRLVNGVDAVSS